MPTVDSVTALQSQSVNTNVSVVTILPKVTVKGVLLLVIRVAVDPDSAPSGSVISTLAAVKALRRTQGKICRRARTACARRDGS